MTYFALTRNKNLYQQVAEILDEKFGCRRTIEIDFSSPKPALIGAYAGVYDFSISHSGHLAAIAVSDKNIGCDLELFKGRERAAVIKRFCAEEREAIKSERDFIENWTAKEAFIKMNAFSLATHLRRLKYVDGRIWLDGCEQNCEIVHLPFDGGTACVCGDGDIKIITI